MLTNSIIKKSASGRLKIGGISPIRVNCNVGANSILQMDYEYKRLKAIQDSDLLPDTFMDLSIGRYDKPLYKEIIRLIGCPVGIVPAYLFTNPSSLNKTEAIHTIIKPQYVDVIIS